MFDPFVVFAGFSWSSSSPRDDAESPRSIYMRLSASYLILSQLTSLITRWSEGAWRIWSVMLGLPLANFRQTISFDSDEDDS